MIWHTSQNLSTLLDYHANKYLLMMSQDLTDNEIDRMVYKLYGLTKEEIKIVEGV